MADRAEAPTARMLHRVASLILNAPLAILPATLETIISSPSIAPRLGVAPIAGEPASAPLQAALDDEDDDRGGDRPPYVIVDGVAVLSIRGETVNRASYLSAASGLISYATISKDMNSAANDFRATAIVVDFDSPGGEAAGAMETADVIRGLSQRKPVVAHVDGLCCSAAYALAAAASRIVVMPSALVGSIGIVCAHFDRSKAYEQNGVKPTLLHSGKYKKDGNSMEPLGDGPRARLQAQLDDFYALFVNSVGKHRPKLGAAGARGTEAGVFLGAKAVAAGLADQVGTFDDALMLARSLSKSSSSSPSPPAVPARPKSEGSFLHQPSLASSAAAAPPRASQAAIDAAWGEIADDLNRKHGFAPRAEARPAPSTARVFAPAPMATRQPAKMSQQKIDALWTSVAAELNAEHGLASPRRR